MMNNAVSSTKTYQFTNSVALNCHNTKLLNVIILQFTNYKISNKRCAAAITSLVFNRVYQCRGNIKQTRYGIFKNNKNKCNVK